MTTTTATSPSNNGDEKLSLFQSRYIMYVVVLVGGAFLCFHVGSLVESYVNVAQDVELRQGSCTCDTPTRNVTELNKLLDNDELVRAARAAKQKVIDNMRVDYGDYLEDIFFGPDKSFVPISHKSTKGLKRKLMMKVLEMQINVLKHKKGGCVCQSKPNSTTFAKYVWATGGHSAAAAHGNLFNETYTAFLGRDARVVFDAIGIDFEDRSYAMGGTASAWEVSMCWDQIFGQDVDFFSWDFGMTDGHNAERMLHYAYRGGLSHGNPAFLAMRIGEGSYNGRVEALDLLSKSGMSVFLGTEASFSKRNEAVPDSAGLTRAEIDALPYLIRNLRCGVNIEAGEPFCGEEKYSKWGCDFRPRQASWHPGFKAHAMDGHAMGLWLIDQLIETLTDLSQQTITDPMQLLDELRQQEIKAAEEFRNATLPVEQILPHENRTSPDPALDLEMFWKAPSLCRTGRLPAQSRFLGYTTNTDKVGNIARLGLEEYDTGISVVEAAKPETPLNGSMPLVWLPGPDRSPCNAVLMPDYKDYFYANEVHGKLAFASLPNEKERRAYDYDKLSFRGLIVIVFVQCEWGRCEAGDVRPEMYPEGKFEMTVNGDRVTELMSIGYDAFIVKGENGFYWKAKSDGTYDLTFWVKEVDGSIRLSSVILY